MSEINIIEKKSLPSVLPEKPLPVEKTAEVLRNNTEQTLNKKINESSLATRAETAQINEENNTDMAQALNLKNIERILSGELEDVYLQMPVERRHSFKQKGEQVAQSIKIELTEHKPNVEKITKMIFRWLKIIEGVNESFLHQESKIKTDEILKLKAL